MLQRYPLHDLLDGRRPALGLIVNFAAPPMVDLAALMGFDFVMLDAEHGPLTPALVEPMLRSAELARIAPIVRVSTRTSDDILRYLDLGVTGIVFPNVESAEDAEEAVRSVRFPPRGTRGVAPNTNASGYGRQMPFRDYMALANETILAIPLIESGKGVDAIESILDVAGITAIGVGPMDLSASLGTPGDPSNPAVRAAIDHVADCCRRRGVPLVLPAANMEQGVESIAKGAGMTLTAVGGLLAGLGTEFTRALRGNA